MATVHPFTTRYQDQVVPALKSEKQYASAYEIPRITHVVVNAGAGDILTAGKGMDQLVELIGKITGQRPVVVKAKKSIAGFKLRAGMEVGVKVSLRGDRMRDFLLKLTDVSLPRTRDYRGVKPTAIAKDGSLHVGIRDTQIFPEVANDNFHHPIQVSLVPARSMSQDEALRLYRGLGFHFQA